MKFLEEKQRDRERRLMQQKLKAQDDMFKRQFETRRTKDKAISLVRNGNFRWHNGKFGFYKDARQEEVPYLQYEDDYGTPYYFDPVTNKSTYEMPTAAPIIHHTVKEREEYDKVNGEGKYDEMIADRKFKDECNRNGGYFSKTGAWLPLNGYYDDNYNFVKLN